MNEYISSAYNCINSGDYESAVAYCNNLLNQDSSNVSALLLKSLGLLLSSKLGDFHSDYEDILKKALKSKAFCAENNEAISDFCNTAGNTTMAYFENNCGIAAKHQFAKYEEADYFFTILYALINYRYLLITAAKEFSDTSNALENKLKEMIAVTKKMAEKYDIEVLFVSGKETNVKNGIPVDKILTKTHKGPDGRDVKKMIKELVEVYNTQPTTVAKIETFDETIGKQKEIIGEFDNAIAAFFKENPDIKKIYNRKFLSGKKKEKYRETLIKLFPEDIKAKKALEKTARENLAKAEADKAAFLKENTIK